MNRLLRLTIAAALASAGCSGGGGGTGMTQAELIARLSALQGVTVKPAATEQAGYQYYVLHFTQWVDHNDHSRGTFQQEVSLLHMNEQAPTPMIVHTSGYSDYYLDQPVELTKLLSANQISIEHRFFGNSVPDLFDPNDPNVWSTLTIRQMADDEHEIITALQTIYEGKFLTTGGSKGGMTAVFHRVFHPEDDIAGTVAYVAPISFGDPDERYVGYLNAIDNPSPTNDGCQDKLKALSMALLDKTQPYRAMLVLAAQQQATTNGNKYTRVLMDAAIESAVVGLQWSFWQYAGIDQCVTIPDLPPSADLTPATFQPVFDFLDANSPVTDDDNASLDMVEAYYYQAESQLGFPDYGTAYLEGDRQYHDSDYMGEMPNAPEPVFDSQAMRDVLTAVESSGTRLMFIYGGFDPWTGGEFAIGDAKDSRVFIQDEGTHDARIATLADTSSRPDQTDALNMLQRWSQVTPQLARARRALVDPALPRTPRALVHAGHAHLAPK